MKGERRRSERKGGISDAATQRWRGFASVKWNKSLLQYTRIILQTSVWVPGQIRSRLTVVTMCNHTLLNGTNSIAVRVCDLVICVHEWTLLFL